MRLTTTKALLALGTLMLALRAPAAEPQPVKTVFAEESWYRQAKVKPEAFDGVLRKAPMPRASSGRTNAYRLTMAGGVVREVYVGAQRNSLDDYLDRRVRIVGKPMVVLGHEEIWPATIAALDPPATAPTAGGEAP